MRLLDTNMGTLKRGGGMIWWVWKQVDELALLYILAVTWREGKGQ